MLNDQHILKPLGRKAYGSIPHLPNSRKGPGDHSINQAQAKMVTERTRDQHDFVVVQEKLDGSNVSVAKLNGKILPLMRAGYLAEQSNHLQHKLFAKWVYKNEARFNDLLKDGERACGEWLVLAHGTRYNLPHEPFVLFDIMTEDIRITYQEFIRRVNQNFIIPMAISVGQALSVELAMECLNAGSGHGAIDPAEGAIWRMERKGRVDFLCKYVRPDKVDGKYFSSVSGEEEVWNVDPNTI